MRHCQFLTPDFIHVDNNLTFHAAFWKPTAALQVLTFMAAESPNQIRLNHFSISFLVFSSLTESPQTGSFEIGKISRVFRYANSLVSPRVCG